MTKMKLMAAAVGLTAVWGGAASAADGGVAVLGDQTRVANLFSYPNCLKDCPRPETLAQTVSHYLTQSLARDGYAGSTVRVTQQAGVYQAHFSGRAAKTYPGAVTYFLDAGDLAFAGQQKLQAAGKWQADWRFFLPLGLAMTRHPTVELLHFPPDYSLTDQDYLDAKTTQRWSGLLQMNGVPPKQTDAYQAIVDIAPIAAPADAGSAIEKADPYSDFSDYIFTLLRSWTSTPSGAAKPMVAFGAPVRGWINSTLGKQLAVDEAAVVAIPGGPSAVPVIASNHPSMIFYAAYNSDKSENFAAGMKVMRQDLIAACWQAGMGQNPKQDPLQAQTACSSYWSSDTKTVCMALETTIYGKPVEQAAQLCGGTRLIVEREPSDEDLAKAVVEH